MQIPKVPSVVREPREGGPTGLRLLGRLDLSKPPLLGSGLDMDRSVGRDWEDGCGTGEVGRLRAHPEP